MSLKVTDKHAEHGFVPHRLRVVSIIRLHFYRAMNKGRGQRDTEDSILRLAQTLSCLMLTTRKRRLSRAHGGQ